MVATSAVDTGAVIGVAALALAFASVWVYLPWLRWRVRVDRIIDKKLAGRDRHGDVFFDPTYEKYYALTGPEYRDVLKDPRYVAERLLEDSANDADPLRRAEAFSAIGRLLAESGSPALAREFFGRILRQAVAGTSRPDDERSAITVIQDLGPHLGLDEAQRTAILARARTLARGPDTGNLLPYWVILIGQIQGDAESEFLLELDDSARSQVVHFWYGIEADAFATAGPARPHPSLARRPGPRPRRSRLHHPSLHHAGPPTLAGSSAHSRAR